MSFDDALEQYDACQNCIYVDECPYREKKIIAALEKRRDDVPCAMDISKGEKTNEE